MCPQEQTFLRAATTLLFQRDVPIRLAEKLGPTSNPHAIARRVHRFPRRPGWRFVEPHPGLLRCPVSLATIAADARQDTVFPGRCSAVRPRDDVVDRQFFAPRLATAILARPVVALKHIAAAEAHGRRGQPVVLFQDDHLGHAQPELHRLDELLILARA